MARPNVTVIIDDQSFVIAGTEAGSITRGGLVSAYGLVQAVGYTGERNAGILTTQSVAEWVNRLKVNDPVGGGTASGAFPTGTAGDLTSQRYPNGPTANWAGEWWAVHNFLQYGGVCVVGGSGDAASASPGTPTSTNSPLHDKEIPLDVIFCGNPSNTGGTALNYLGTPSTLQVQTLLNIASTRGDVLAMVPMGFTGADLAANDPSNIAVYDGGSTGNTVGQPVSEFVSIVFGNKRHLGIDRDTTGNIADLVTTNCSADAAGCIARTDRETAPWYSPAGARRGQILDVVRMQDTPTDAEMDTLYDNKVNVITTFPGEGTMLFGDKTTEVATSTLSRINVSRLFIYLKKTVGAAARSKLFEFNDTETRASFVNAVSPLLENIRARRGIFDYRVICDETNNTASIVDSNQFVADIFIKPTKSINFIKITFTNKNTADDLGGN